MNDWNIWIHVAVACALTVTNPSRSSFMADANIPPADNNLAGGCTLNESWGGRWFQLGAGRPIVINTTHVETKGQCLENQLEKYIFYDRTEHCYRCLGMYEQHRNVLQYKESYCMPDNLGIEDLCNEIPGDAVLMSMFRMDGVPVSCPFKNPPFTLIYNRGYGDCSQPASRADACTVDTRLVLRYQACPDIIGTEAAVEELECLGQWREGSSKYLVGRFHHKLATTDEQRYRCFVYKKLNAHTYEVAQSGDATCSGLYSSNEGSTTLRLTRMESKEKSCKFPQWVTAHYHWHSLDYSHSYHFSHRNASLKVSGPGGELEAKLACHTVLADHQHQAKLVVHVVSGCDGGYKCMTFHKRDPHVIQIQQSAMSPDPSEACNPSYVDQRTTAEPITLTTASLPTKKCPLDGKYAPPVNKKKALIKEPKDECSSHTTLQTLFVGCTSARDTLQFQSTCRTVPTTAYSCHGSWTDNMTTYVIGSPVNRHSTDARHYCFIFSHTPNGYVLKRVAETCDVSSRLEWTFNITETGKCAEASKASNGLFFGPLLLISIVISIAAVLR